MKISKSLLNAILIGVTIGTASSCTGLVEEVKTEDLQHQCNEQCNESCENSAVNTDYCPPCGMG